MKRGRKKKSPPPSDSSQELPLENTDNAATNDKNALVRPATDSEPELELDTVPGFVPELELVDEELPTHGEFAALSEDLKERPPTGKSPDATNLDENSTEESTSPVDPEMLSQVMPAPINSDEASHLDEASPVETEKPETLERFTEQVKPGRDERTQLDGEAEQDASPAVACAEKSPFKASTLPDAPKTPEVPALSPRPVSHGTLPQPAHASVRFVHAADLHLDAVFSGISRDMPADMARRLHQATFTALENLFALCERVRPDFLLLAGDIYNQEDRSLGAQLAVRDGCARLETLGVQVFIVHGNHDPLSSRLKTLPWPGSVTIFGDQVESHVLFRNGEPLAAIHGVSHANPRETRNLAATFSRTKDQCLHVGLLHTTLGDADGDARYAPCSIDDLKASGLDYWALGHIHDRRVLSERPLAQYSGSTQGLHVHEQGPHGCLLVTAAPEGNGFTFSTVFQPLGPVEWHVLTLTLEDDTTIDDFEELARTALSNLVTKAVAARGKGAYLVMPCTALIARLRLEGRTALDTDLRRPAVLADILERLRNEHTNEPFVWVKDIDVDTRPLIDRAVLAKREDLLGEILRLADRLREDPVLMAGLGEAALSDLYGHARARKVLAMPTEGDLRALLLSAETACLDLLENE